MNSQLKIDFILLPSALREMSSIWQDRPCGRVDGTQIREQSFV